MLFSTVSFLNVNIRHKKCFAVHYFFSLKEKKCCFKEKGILCRYNMYSAWNFARAPFETFVFMDLEATGLPPTRPKITEISLLAVNRHSLENTKFSNSFNPVPVFPRVVDKLCLCINPEKYFTPIAEDITGLNNKILRDNGKQNFNMHIVEGIKAFLNRQHPPVCFVAHNGYRYDFPLLKAELSRHGCYLLDDLYCADTLTAIKVLDSADNHFYQFASKQLAGRKKANYSLRELYFKVFHEYPVDSHTAECDAIALIGVFQWRAMDLISWMDLNAKQFADIKPMYEETFQEEMGPVSTAKGLRNTPPFKSHLTYNNGEDVIASSNEFDTRGRKRSVGKRPFKSEISENFLKTSPASERCDGKPRNPISDHLNLVVVLFLIFVICVYSAFVNDKGKN